MSAAMIPKDWPHRAASAFVEAGGLRWHVQRLGSGPTVLLVHGAAASTHSFRDLADALTSEFDVVMVDLPGHGFTGAMDAPTLPRVAQALGALLRRIGADPAMAAGHSAGAAVVLRMTLDALISPEALAGFAPALQPYGGAADGLASRLTKVAFVNPIAPRLLSLHASPDRVRKIIARTGSHLDDAGVDYYVRLLKRPEHVAGALRMMANWNLRPLLEDLPALSVPVTFVVGETDQATPAADAERLAKRLKAARGVRLPDEGHLAHEQHPQVAARVVRELLAGAPALDRPNDQRSAAL